MATFNQQTLNTYFNNRDFNGAADYLSSLKAKDPQSQRELNNRIRQLRKQAEIQNAYVSQLDTNGVQAYHFINSLNGNGTIPHTQYNDNGQAIAGTANSYGDNYISLINNLHITHNGQFKGQRINTIQIKLDADYLNAFANRLGVNDIKNNNLGITYSTNSEGKHLINIPTNNVNLVKALKAAKSLDYMVSSVSSSATKGALTGAAAGASMGAMAGSIIPGIGTAFGAGVGGIIGTLVGATTYAVDEAIQYESPYEIIGLGKDVIAPASTFNSGSLYDLIDIVDEAQEKQQTDEKKIGNITINEEMYVTPFLGHGHANAYKRLASGAISIDEYNKIVEERTNTYNTLLKQADLTQYKVFAGGETLDDSENLVMTELDNPSRLELMKNLSVAIADKRVTYSAAIRGGEMGTYITIAADKDKNGDLSEGSTERFTRIFIPGLFQSSCDESFNNDTKTMAARDNADMKRWNYGKRLHNGTYVGYCKDLGSYTIVKDANGQEIKTPISEDDILSALNRENIIDGSVDNILLMMSQTDNNTDIDSLIQLAATVGTNELYPAEQYDRRERIYQQEQLYKDIYSLLNVYISNNENN